ncbi:uncharacterized protein METZ01_LOCUS259382 [marine metagenome]|uniref:Uncharacterized protein n=1 Tax=marine metagenome TaxID=408172 RepID=A0A382J423_9ZZZZ
MVEFLMDVHDWLNSQKQLRLFQLL